MTTEPVSPPVPGWDHFVHGADIGLEGRGADPAGAFEQAALALTAVLVDPSEVRSVKEVTVTCEAPDLELLLVDWLNGLIYEMAARRMLFGRYAVFIEGDRLYGCAWGEPADPGRHQPAVEVKGATYTQLSVNRMQDGTWIARCVVDV